MAAFERLQVSLFEVLQKELSAIISTFHAAKATLVDISHTLEDCILQDRLPSVILTGFQESSHWRAETERYLELAESATKVCIFAGGVPPVPEEKHIAVTLAESDPLRQEWFLLILTHKFSAVLCGLDNQNPVEVEADRTFQTILSFDPQVVARTIETIMPVVQHYRPDRAEELAAAAQAFPPGSPDGLYVTKIITRVVDHLQKRYNQQRTQLHELQQLRMQQVHLENVVAELAVPVVPLLDGVLVLPLVGTIDTRRAQQIMENLLTGIADQQADIAIIDITGVPIVDTAVANYLVQTIRAAGLIGAQVVLTGIGANIAQMLVSLDVDFSKIITRSNLRDGIEVALAMRGLQIASLARG